MRRHPPVLEIVGAGFVCEDVHEKLSAWFESGGDFGEEQLVILHVLKELDAKDAVKGSLQWCASERISSNVPGYDFKVPETLLGCLAIDVLFLRSGIGERRDLAVGEYLGKVK